MGYLVVGILWTFWLEWYTTSQLKLEWSLRERIFHVMLWPVSLSIFIYNFFKLKAYVPALPHVNFNSMSPVQELTEPVPAVTV